MKRTETTVDLSELLHGASLLNSDAHSDFITAVRVLDCHCLLGEGIVYDDTASAVLFVDIDGKVFHEVALDFKDATRVVHRTYELPKKMGSMGLLATRKEGTSLPLFCAWEDGFQLYDVAVGKELSPLSQGPDVNPHKDGSRLNDGRVDRQGKRFVCGGYYNELPNVTMQLFKVKQNESGSIVHDPIMDGIHVTNAICWSLDGNRMYLADSPKKEIHSYAYESDIAELTDKKRVFAHDGNDKGVPDGACVDSEGFLWNAIYNSNNDNPGVVHRINPHNGLVVYTVHLPDNTSQVTCCCFGGELLDILFITTAAHGKQDEQPHSGALYAAKVPFTGITESRLDFNY